MSDALSRTTLSHTTLIIVIVCAALAAVVLVVLALNLLRARHRRPAPLPPVQPLAHHRIPKYDPLDSRPPSSVPDSPQNIPPIPNPSFQSFDSAFPPPSPASSVSRAVPPRPLSSASLSSAGHMSRRTSRTNLRGVPHAPTSQVQIILPTPLSATLPRPLSMRRDTESDRMSVVDKWVSVGRDDFSTMPSTPRSARRASASATTFTSSSSSTYFQHPSPPPPVPQIPKGMMIPLPAAS